jgi:hypothetical protein
MPSVERTTPVTRSMKGSAATVEVLYPEYRGTPVMTQPRNPARDTPRLPAITHGASSTGTTGTQMVNTPSNIYARGTSHPPERRHRPM